MQNITGAVIGLGIMPSMSEIHPSSEPATGPLATAAPPPPPAYVPPAGTPVPVAVEQKSNRLYKAAAWVMIVAGVVFIVAVVFFSGFALGRHSGGGFGGHHRFAEYRDRVPMMPMERSGPPFVLPGPGFQVPQPPGGPPTVAPTRPQP